MVAGLQLLISMCVRREAIKYSSITWWRNSSHCWNFFAAWFTLPRLRIAWRWLSDPVSCEDFQKRREVTLRHFHIKWKSPGFFFAHRSCSGSSSSAILLLLAPRMVTCCLISNCTLLFAGIYPKVILNFT